MIVYLEKRHKSLPYRILSAFIAFTFAFSLVLPPGYAQLIPQTLLNLPAPGTMVSTSAAFTPALINGITIHPENPLEFDFIVGTGDENLEGKAFEEESTRLIKYFLASLTVPEDQMWVNLSPYEKDRIVPQGFGQTEMGRDLLAQDYILKQLTASLMYPEKELGGAFWKKIYQKAYEQYGTTEIPMNTFNKVWIVPEKAVVYEHGNSAFVVKSHLRVMLEQDYLAASQGHKVTKSQDGDLVTGDVVATNIIREVILPAIEQEVNEGKTFTHLRQIYNSVILAAWFKQNLKETLLGQVYVDKTRTKGIDVEDKEVNQKIYAQYLEAFKKGVYNYIKEDTDPATQEIIPRKYFSGGTTMNVGDLVETYKKDQGAQNLSKEHLREQQEVLGEYLAGQRKYNRGQNRVNVNLVELSKKTSVADAWAAIEASKSTTSSPITIPEIAGNWKKRPFKDEQEARAKAKEFKNGLSGINKERAKITIYVEDQWMKAISEEWKDSNISVGVQSFHFDPKGNVEQQIQDAVDQGAKHAMIGHSMHRYPDSKVLPGIAALTNEGANTIVKEILKDGRLKLWYIVAVDEDLKKTLSENDGYIKQQIFDGINIGLDGVTEEQVADIVITAEPLHDISTKKGDGTIDPKTQVNFPKVEMLAKYLAEALNKKFGKAAEVVNTGYGASASPDTSEALLKHPDVFNILPGGKSLEISTFLPLVENGIKGFFQKQKAPSPVMDLRVEEFIRDGAIELLDVAYGKAVRAKDKGAEDTLWYTMGQLERESEFYFIKGEDLLNRLTTSAAASFLEEAYNEKYGTSSSPVLAQPVPVSTPEFFANGLKARGFKVREVAVAALKAQGLTPVESVERVFSQPYVKDAVSISIAQALGSILFAGRGSEAKVVADSNAVWMGHESLVDMVTRNPDIAIASIASEGIRDGSVGTPLGRIYWSGYENKFRNSADKADYEAQIIMLRQRGVQILYLLDDGLENTNALKDKEALIQPTDAWSAAAFQVDDGVTPFRHMLDEKNTRRLSVMANAPGGAGLTALDSPRATLKKLAAANGISQLDSPEGRAFAKKIIMAVLSERKKEDTKESSSQRHAFYLEGPDGIQALQREYGVRFMEFGDGDLMPGLVAATGIKLDDNGSIVVKFGRSGLVEGEIMELGASQIDDAQFAARAVSNAATKDRVTPETALNVEDGLLARLVDEFGYPKDTFHVQRTQESRFRGKGIVAMTAVTGADPARYLQGFADQLKRINFNEDEGTVTLNTFLISQDGVFAVRTTLESDNLQQAKSSISSVSPEAKAYLAALEGVRGLVNKVSNVLQVTPTGVEIADVQGFKQTALPYLVNEARYAKIKEVRTTARRIIREAGISLGIKEASIHDFYMARQQGAWSNMTTPAFNVRTGSTMLTMEEIIATAVETNAGPYILELAASEQRYTGQDASEYVAMAYAAAMAVGYHGLLFLQADHYQTDASFLKEQDPVKRAEKQTAAIKKVEKNIRDAVLAGKLNIDVDPSTAVRDEILEEVLKFEREKTTRYIVNRMAVDTEFASRVNEAGELKEKPEDESEGFWSLRRKLVDDMEVGLSIEKYRNTLSAAEQLFLREYGLSEQEHEEIRSLYKQMHEETLALTKHYIVFIRKLEKELGLKQSISIGVEERHIDNKKHSKYPSTVLGSITIMNAVTSWSKENGYVPPSKLALQTGAMHGLGGTVDWGIFERHQLASELIGVSVFVQHGTSTLPPGEFANMPPVGSGEAHLATEYQKIAFRHIAEDVPELRGKMVEYMEALINPELQEAQVSADIVAKIKTEKLWEKRGAYQEKFGKKYAAFMGSGLSRDQVAISMLSDEAPEGYAKFKGSVKDLTKEVAGPFKKEIDTLPTAIKQAIRKELRTEFRRIFNVQKVENSRALLDSIIPVDQVQVVLPARPEMLQLATVSSPVANRVLRIAKKYSFKSLKNDNFIFVYKNHVDFLNELIKEGYGDMKIRSTEGVDYPNTVELTPNTEREEVGYSMRPGLIIVSKSGVFKKGDLPKKKELVYKIASDMGEVDQETGEVAFHSKSAIIAIARSLSANGLGKELIRDEHGKEMGRTEEIDPFFASEYVSDSYTIKHTTYREYTINRYDPHAGNYYAGDIILVFRKDGSITEYYKISGGAPTQEEATSSPVSREDVDRFRNDFLFWAGVFRDITQESFAADIRAVENEISKIREGDLAVTPEVLVFPGWIVSLRDTVIPEIRKLTAPETSTPISPETVQRLNEFLASAYQLLDAAMQFDGDMVTFAIREELGYVVSYEKGDVIVRSFPKPGDLSGKSKTLGTGKELFKKAPAKGESASKIAFAIAEALNETITPKSYPGRIRSIAESAAQKAASLPVSKERIEVTRHFLNALLGPEINLETAHQFTQMASPDLIARIGQSIKDDGVFAGVYDYLLQVAKDVSAGKISINPGLINLVPSIIFANVPDDLLIETIGSLINLDSTVVGLRRRAGVAIQNDNPFYEWTIKHELPELFANSFRLAEIFAETSSLDQFEALKEYSLKKDASASSPLKEDIKSSLDLEQILLRIGEPLLLDDFHKSSRRSEIVTIIDRATGSLSARIKQYKDEQNRLFDSQVADETYEMTRPGGGFNMFVSEKTSKYLRLRDAEDHNEYLRGQLYGLKKRIEEQMTAGDTSSLAGEDQGAGGRVQEEVLRDTSDEIQATKEVGGINLDPKLLDLQIKRDGNGVPLPLPMQPIENMHIEGFLPVIINVTPVTNLPLLLGIADDQLPTDSADSGAPSMPMTLSLAVKEDL